VAKRTIPTFMMGLLYSSVSRTFVGHGPLVHPTRTVVVDLVEGTGPRKFHPCIRRTLSRWGKKHGFFKTKP